MAHAPSLTAKQQKKALSNEKKKKITPKNILCTPYFIKWPPFIASLDEEVQNKLLTELIKHDLKRPTIDKHLTKSERQESLRKQREDPVDIQRQSVRHWLICGVNAVTRAVERHTASVVLVDRAAFTLTRHLMELCAVRGCTFVPLTSLAQTSGPLLFMTQLSALAFKSGDGPFSGFVDFVKQKVPKLELPWLTVEDKESEGVTVLEPCVEELDRQLGLVEKDAFACNNATSAEVSSSKDRLGDFVCFGTDKDDSESESGSDTTKVKSGLVSCANKEDTAVFDIPLGSKGAVSRTDQGKTKWVKDKKRKNRSVEENSHGVKKVKRAQNVKYHSANLHKLHGNVNRKGKKKPKNLQ